MEQPESNPTFCTNNCGFYGSSQFEGMCSKCYRDHASRSYDAGLANSCTSMSSESSHLKKEMKFPFFEFFLQGYYSSNTSVQTSSPNRLEDDMTKEIIPSSIEMNNSDEQMKQDNTISLIPHVDSAPVLSEVSSTNDSSLNETSSLGKNEHFA